MIYDMNFIIDFSTHSTVNSVSYTQLFSSVNEPNLLIDDFTSGI
jgi:hypothetical protein